MSDSGVLAPFDTPDAYGSGNVKAFRVRVDGDAYDRLVILADGNIYQGDGTTPPALFAGGGGGGAVDSVNGLTGVVVLDAGDVGADPAGTGATQAASAVSTHVGLADPHTQYQLESALTEDVQDIVGAMVLPTTGLVNATYSDVGGTITLAIDTAILDERIQDVIGAAILPTSGLVNATYSDVAGTITLAIDTATLDERVMDVIATMIVAGSGVSASYNDAGNQLTISATGSISDAAYGVGWNADTTTAPSKNAVYDKIETLQPLDTQLTDIAALTPTNGQAIVGNGSGFVMGTPTAAREPITKILMRRSI